MFPCDKETPDPPCISYNIHIWTSFMFPYDKETPDPPCLWLQALLTLIFNLYSSLAQANKFGTIFLYENGEIIIFF